MPQWTKGDTNKLHPQSTIHNSTTVFQQKNDDPLLPDAEESVSSFSNTSLGDKSWASVVSDTKKFYQTISTVTTTNELSIQMAQLSQSINKICNCLDALEQRMNKQDEMIQKMQHYKTTSMSHVE